ncbi:AAA family ATPase [Micromonospora zamorensis]|uniref:AAA family ATPase n=1 Tax=Micromonospora zamorensis TaxID=709883 RepID=UPI00399D7601
MDQSRPVVYLLVGLPGSGKSTYARALELTGVVRLSVDDVLQARHGRLGKDYPADRHVSCWVLSSKRCGGSSSN